MSDLITVNPPAAPVPAAAAQPLVRRLTYTGQTWPLFMIHCNNLLLTVVTLGIYRYWAKTKIRRFFHENTFFTNEPFIYLGNGGEMFRSSLRFIFKVMVPLFALTGVAGAILPPTYTAIVAMAQILLLRGIIMYSKLSGLRYRANRMSWRGIRFALRVRRMEYVKLMIKNLLLNVVTLGLYRPHGDAAMIRLFCNQLYFGNLRFSYNGKTSDLTSGYFQYWLLVPFTLGFSMTWYRARLYRHLAK